MQLLSQISKSNLPAGNPGQVNCGVVQADCSSRAVCFTVQLRGSGVKLQFSIALGGGEEAGAEGLVRPKGHISSTPPPRLPYVLLKREIIALLSFYPSTFNLSSR